MTGTHDPRWNNVYWIGGAPDTGKSTVANIIAERHNAEVYHYDRTDLQHHEELAKTDPEVRRFLDASMDERWLDARPDELAHRALKSFRDRFPLVIQDLAPMLSERPIIVEGFGFLPSLLQPLLPSADHAAFVIPSSKFKHESMLRRGKPSFANQTRDAERTRRNLIDRDEILARQYQAEAERGSYLLITIDGAELPEQIVHQLEHHFKLK
jgi:adenylate kinase family enzyme